MEDKEVIENYDDNSNSDKDSSGEIKRLDDRINKLKDFITKEYTEELLKEIGNRLNFEKLKDTPSIIKESSNKIQSLSLELNNLKEEDIPNILKSLEEIVDEKFRDLKNNEINEFKEKYQTVENISSLVKENSNKIQDLKLETDNLKTSILKELGEKINVLDEKYFGTIENLKNNEISKLDTKYSEVLGKFDNLKDDIIKEKDEKIKEIKDINNKLIQKLEKEIENTKNQMDGLNEKLEAEKESVKELEIKNSSAQVELKTLKEQLTEKKEDIKTKVEELEELKKSNIELNQKLEREKESTKNQTEILNEKIKELEVENNSNKVSLEALKEQMKLKEVEIERKARELKEINILNIELNQKTENLLKDKEYQVHSLKEKMEKEKIENENLIGELKIKLNTFYDKIEKPYENLLKAITESTKADTIGNYLGFNNEKGLSKSMILFALASDDNLARKIALFYSERKEIMVEEDFRIVKEVNNIYVNKPWGILYAEAEGPYQSSLLKDRKSSSIYKNFTAMYSPAYRPDENGNSPIKGIVDGK
jgi:viral A-type inclusion protein, putative